MPHKSVPLKWYVPVLVGLAVLALVVLIVSLGPRGSPSGKIVRMLALLGYTLVFLSIVSSAFTREIAIRVGRPFIKAHHIISVAGLALITLHPLAAAVSLSWGILIPSFDSWIGVITWAGRPAWVLIVLGALAAAFRRRVGQRWRWVHVQNYVAFGLASVHGMLLGTDGATLPGRAVAAIMLATVVAVLVRRRLHARKPATRPLATGS